MFYLLKKIKKPNQGKKDDDERSRLEKNFEVLKVKEYLRTFEGRIEVPANTVTDYVVLSNQHSSVLP
jgi:hypothetical protein